MEKEFFAEQVKASEEYEKIDYSGFWWGYRRGLRKLYYSQQKMQNTGSQEEHEAWLDAATSTNESARSHGQGYKAGFAGKKAMELFEKKTGEENVRQKKDQGK